MADLLKIKQVDGLGTSLDSLDSKDASIVLAFASADTAQSVDSKDASVLTAANTYADTAEADAITAAGSLDTAQSVDSKDASVLTAAGSLDTAQSVDSKDASVLTAANTYADTAEADAITAAGSLDVAQSVDSKDASVLTAANAYSDSKDVAQSVDSKDASVLTAANTYTDTAMGSFTLNVHSNGIDSASISGSNGSYTITLSTAMESASATYVQGVFINGLFTKFSVNSTTELAISTIGYDLDNQDVVVVQFIAAF